MSVKEIKRFSFVCPFTCLVVGSTSSGKTTLLSKILIHKELFQKKVHKIIYIYGIYQPFFDEMKNVSFYSIDEFSFDLLSENNKEHKLVILDDLMYCIKSNKKYGELFTRGSHHNNVSVFFTTQNMFFNDSVFRDIHLNSQYIILFRIKRDNNQVNHLARQLDSKCWKNIVTVYEECTDVKYGYCLFDIHPASEFKKYAIYTKILPYETQIVYYP